MAQQHSTTAVSSTRTRRSPLLATLDREWLDLNASPTVGDLIARWAETCPSLDGLQSLEAILDRINQTRGREQDAIFASLLQLFAGKEKLAGRVLLQAMLPALLAQVRRSVPPRGVTYDEQLQRVVVEFWDVISRPRPLGHGIASRLSLDTLKRFTAHRRSADAWESVVDYGHLSGGGDAGGSTGDPMTWSEEQAFAIGAVDGGGLVEGPEAALDLNPMADLLDLVTTYRRSGALSASDAQLLADVYLVPNQDKTLADTATRLGMSHAALRQRIARCKARLLEAVISDQRSDRDYAATA